MQGSVSVKHVRILRTIPFSINKPQFKNYNTDNLDLHFPRVWEYQWRRFSLFKADSCKMLRKHWLNLSDLCRIAARFKRQVVVQLIHDHQKKGAAHTLQLVNFPTLRLECFRVSLATFRVRLKCLTSVTTTTKDWWLHLPINVHRVIHGCVLSGAYNNTKIPKNLCHHTNE